MLQKARARVRSRGPGEVARTVVAGTRARLWSRGSIVILRRATDEETLPATELDLRFAQVEDGHVYERDIGTDSAESFRARLEPGTRCFVVLDGGRMLHATWVTTAGAWASEVQRYFVPPPGHAYVYESFTRPDARGRGIYPLALRTMAHLLAKDSITCMWIAVESDNAASLRSVTKAGFTPTCRAVVARRAGLVTVRTDALDSAAVEDCWVLTKSLPE